MSRLGTLAAFAQLGTAFADMRALFTTEARQRIVDMDLRFICKCECMVSIKPAARYYAMICNVQCHSITLLNRAVQARALLDSNALQMENKFTRDK